MRHGREALVRLSVLSLLMLGAALTASRAQAECGQDCRTLIANEFDACENACRSQLVIDGTACRTAANPIVPDCGRASSATTTTTSDTIPAPTTTTIATGTTFTCTEILGFSQSLMWHETTEFQQQIDDGRWQMRFRAGGDVDLWADPNADAWTAPVHTDCLGVGSPVLCSPCDRDSGAPDRVLFTITLQAYESDVEVWAQKIRAAIATIRLQHPQVRQIVLQPAVGGPMNTVCPFPRTQLGVRASFNHPYIEQAIAEVVNDSSDLVAGFSPEVRFCSDYSDGVGHLTPMARGPVGLAIGQYYGP